MMSEEPEDKLIQSESVDVNKEGNENVYICETTSDSGVPALDSCSTACTSSPICQVSSIKSTENNEKAAAYGGTENYIDSISSTSASISPDCNYLTDNSTEGYCPLTVNKDEKSEGSPTKAANIGHSILVPDLLCKSIIDMPTSKDNDELNFSNVHSELASSSVSLNEPKVASIYNSETISKIPYSKSAENISVLQETQNKYDQTSSNDEINADEVLSTFTNQKMKMSTTQKIPEQTQSNANTNYARLQKELIPQDLGSIVKNVHGIFSTVSGSLKNVYNTQRMSMHKAPIKNVAKPIPNGKVMSDIFEEDAVENSAEHTPNDKPGSQEMLQNTDGDVKIDADSNESDVNSKKDMLKLQVEMLEKLLAEQRKENASLRDRLKEQLDELQEKDQTNKNFETKLDVMSKRVEQAEREKDAAVMRYASVECASIEAKRVADKAAAAERAALAEVELLHNKLKSAHGEKQRICQLYDDKCHELSNCEREVSKVREELRELEGRLKWTQSKLRMEMDAYKDSAEKVEKLSHQVSELEAAREAAANSAEDSAKAKQLESDLKESQAALILCRHEKAEVEKRLSSCSQQLEACTRERDSANSALAATQAEVEQLKVNNLRLEEEAAELAALRAQAALADTLSAQLQREAERCARAESSLAEARALGETCARREAAALEHAARLTAAHVQRSHAAHAHMDQVQALRADNTSLRERVTALEEECTKLTGALADETERRNKENKVLARKVAELTEELADSNKKLEWEKGETGVLKKKHASAIKELNRELHRALKRCEQLEAKLPHPDAASTLTGSVTSLSSSESTPQEERLQNGHSDAMPEIQVREPDRQALIERIVSLQRAAARRAERCDFLEEHSKQLTGELRAKAKLLRHLLCSMPAGAVASQDRDANKKEIARLGGGAMAAVWGGDPGGMTLELSLEMNKRLQAVLEDALLKNITLKENMDTLGAEISRLKSNHKAEEPGKSN